jgi:FkbH-like protein
MRDPMITSHSFVLAASFPCALLKPSVCFWAKSLGLDLEVIIAPYGDLEQQIRNSFSLFRRDFQSAGAIIVAADEIVWDNGRLLYTPCQLDFSILLPQLSAERRGPLCLAIAPALGGKGTVAKTDLSAQSVRPTLTEHLRYSINVDVIDLTAAAQMMKAKEFRWLSDNGEHLPFSEELYASAGTALMRWLYVASRPPKKVIVTDCDNTLWSGVAAEDGIDCLTVEDQRRQYHEWLKRKSSEGFLVCVCSKSDEESTTAALKLHTPLGEQDIAISKINWLPKSLNLAAIATALNVGPDSFVFIDDDPTECSEVQHNCPGVVAFEFPANVHDIERFLNSIWCLDKPSVTREDSNRNSSLDAECSRQMLRSKLSDYDSFLDSLQLQITVRNAEVSDVSRISQMISRFNQFNATKRPISVECVETSRSSFCWVIEARDKFGDYGLVGALEVEAVNAVANVKSFVLSCRALGKAIDDSVLVLVAEYLNRRSCVDLTIETVDTGRNWAVYSLINRIPVVTHVSQTRERVLYSMDVCQLIAASQKYKRSYGYRFAPPGLEEKMYKAVDIPAVGRRTNVVDESCLPFKMHTAALVIQAYRSKFPISETSLGDENLVAKVFYNLLRTDTFGVDDDLFDLGGDSLMAVEALAHIEQHSGIQLPLGLLFHTRFTIRALSHALQSERTKSRQVSLEEQHPLP